MILLELLYALCSISLSIYGINSLLLTWLYLRHRSRPEPQLPAPADWPPVTVQLPIYNELHTVERLLEAVSALDYPSGKLEIQLLDDSTDATRQIAERAVARLVEQGVRVSHLRRDGRAGYKAGALAHGLERARGELVAIFDADFCPRPNFLRLVVPHFVDPTVGCVQARWGHLNRDYSLFTRVQGLGVDGHFVVEQFARSRAGLLLNFNGTGGVWRRTAIEDAGGWQGDTLTEDLDLSFRAQLRGWRIRYLPDVVVPAELPAQIDAYRRQQARWAQGSIQTVFKILGRLLSSGLPWYLKTEGLVHLTGYMAHPLMVLMILLTLPMGYSDSWVLSAAPWLMIAAGGPPLLYAVAQSEGEGARLHRLRALPLLVLLGTGLSLGNALAVLRALAGSSRGFQRTPKYALRTNQDTWVGSTYAGEAGVSVWGELVLALYSLALLSVPNVHWGLVPWLLVYAGGFAYVAGVSIYQDLKRRFWQSRARSAAGDTAGRTPRSGPKGIPSGSPGQDR